MAGSMIMHTLNCDPEHFDLILAGQKLFEIRLADRNYQVGDHLDLRRAGRRDVEAMRELSKIEAGRVEGHGPGLSAAQHERLEQLRSCPRLRCTITSKVRLSGAIVPAEPHWWKPNEAMQHGVVVLGLGGVAQ